MLPLFKQCYTCKEEKPFYLFNKNVQSEDELSCYCKGCIPRKKEKGSIRGYTVQSPYPTLEFPVLEPIGKEREKLKDKLPWNRMINNTIKRIQKFRKQYGLRFPGSFYCTYKELKKYIESQFNKGMTWGNYGILWEIDHIKAICFFDKNNIEDLKLINHYTNLRPLLKEDNRKKQKENREIRFR